MRHKVRVGKKYVFDPVLIDVCDNITGLKKGDIVTVVNLPGCPRANIMNHCHISHNGKFVGLVHINSLKPIEYSRNHNYVLFSVNDNKCKIVAIVSAYKPKRTRAWQNLVNDPTAIRPRTIGYCKNEYFQDELNINGYELIK